MTPTFEPLYRDVLALPDREARRVRLQALDQAIVNHLYEKGYLVACPIIQVRFNEETSKALAPQGIPRAGARAEQPGQVIMRSDPRGRVASEVGCMPSSSSDEPLREVLLHRWITLFHEVGHFAFDQLPAVALVRPLEGHLPSNVMAGIREHVWAPFLKNLERHRLSESFADTWASAALLAWMGERARPEVEALREARAQARLASEEAWNMGDVPASRVWLHLSDQALGRLLRAPLPQSHPEVFLRTVITHAVMGTLDRWQTQGEQAKEDVCQSWSDPAQLSNLQAAVLHARQNQDHGLLETWMTDHPDHPWMALAQRLRWQAPATPGKGLAWQQAWNTEGQEGMELVLARLDQVASQWSFAASPSILSVGGARRSRRP